MDTLTEPFHFPDEEIETEIREATFPESEGK